MKENTTLARLRGGATTYGCAIQLYPAVEIPRLLAAAGFDWFFVDAEHGAFNPETTQQMIGAAVAAGITPLVRVCELLYSLVARSLDAGAHGIILPRVEDPRLLEQAVSWMRYPPVGVRGYGVFPPLMDYEPQSMPAVMDHLNRNVMVVVQFETVRALEMADELLSVDGIDAVMVGPSDLSISMGIAGEFEHPRLVDAVARLAEKCNARGIAPGLHSRSADAAKRWAERGMRFAGAGSEQSMLLETARAAVKTLRS